MTHTGLADAISALETASRSPLDIRLSAGQARALLERIKYLETDNRTLRAQHQQWHKLAAGEATAPETLSQGFFEGTL